MSSSEFIPYESYRGALYRLLSANLPRFTDHQNRLQVPVLASALGMSKEGVYKWLRANRLRVANARRLIELSDNRLTLEDFHDFIA